MGCESTYQDDCIEKSHALKVLERRLPSVHLVNLATELSLSKSAHWTRATGRGNKRSAPPQYQGPQPSTLSLEMFFDATDTQDNSVVKRVEQLFACCVPTATSHDQKKGSPPWVLFRWGGLTGFLAYISSVTAKYTVFTADGMSSRVGATVSRSSSASVPESVLSLSDVCLAN